MCLLGQTVPQGHGKRTLHTLPHLLAAIGFKSGVGVVRGEGADGFRMFLPVCNLQRNRLDMECPH